MGEFEFEPVETIIEFLDSNQLNQAAYQQLADKSNKWHNVFEPLVFFNTLYAAMDTIRQNKLNPHDFIIDYLEKLEPAKDKRYFLLTFLLEVMRLEHKGDSAIQSCWKSIKERLWRPLEEKYRLANMPIYTTLSIPKVNVTISPYPKKWKAVEKQLKSLSPEEKIIYMEKELINLESEDLVLGANQQQAFQEDRRRFAERIKLKIREIKLISGDDKPTTDKPKVKNKKKPGKPKAEIKPIENYISESVGNKALFLTKLKEEFKDASPKQFIYMLYCMDKMGLLNYNYRKGVFYAFGEFFGGDYGSEINLTKTWNNPNDSSFLKTTTEKIQRIIQASNSATH